VRLQELFKEVLDAAGWLNNKKAKGRYLRYVRLMNQLGHKGRKLVMPNSTRVAGIVLQLKSLLMERWNLYKFYHLVQDLKEINDDQFWLCSQVYAVLHPLMLISQQVQTDRIGASSYTYYLIMRLLCMYYIKDHYWVVETRRSSNPDKETRWGGINLVWPKTNYSFTPCDYGYKKEIKNGEIKGTLCSLGMAMIPRDHLHPVAKPLIKRIKKEFVNYGAKPSKAGSSIGICL
jgi:hypothetical protein